MNNNECLVLRLKDLGHDLRSIRRTIVSLSGETHQAIANRIGCHRVAVTSVINGTQLTAGVQEKLAEMWGVPVDVLFERKNGGNADPQTDARD